MSVPAPASEPTEVFAARVRHGGDDDDGELNSNAAHDDGDADRGNGGSDDLCRLGLGSGVGSWPPRPPPPHTGA